MLMIISLKLRMLKWVLSLKHYRSLKMGLSKTVMMIQAQLQKDSLKYSLNIMMKLQKYIRY